eukprot:10426332-Ditylum_brightwellii.AAC.1
MLYKCALEIVQWVKNGKIAQFIRCLGMLWEGDICGGRSKEVARRILDIGIRNDGMAKRSGAKRPRPLRLSGRV